MKLLAIAAVAVVVSCASPEPADTQSSQLSQASQSSSEPNYQDARSVASDAAVRDARRAYRSACQQSRSDDWCECMTGGMAQALPPAELAIATAEFSGQSIQASQSTRAHVAQTRAAVEQSCSQYR
ncbi:MAG: hypothetical protein R3C27_13200 [Hyphomonadaceae bacterium]